MQLAGQSKEHHHHRGKGVGDPAGAPAAELLPRKAEHLEQGVQVRAVHLVHQSAGQELLLFKRCLTGIELLKGGLPVLLLDHWGKQPEHPLHHIQGLQAMSKPEHPLRKLQCDLATDCEGKDDQQLRKLGQLRGLHNALVLLHRDQHKLGEILQGLRLQRAAGAVFDHSREALVGHRGPLRLRGVQPESHLQQRGLHPHKHAASCGAGALRAGLPDVPREQLCHPSKVLFSRRIRGGLRLRPASGKVRQTVHQPSKDDLQVCAAVQLHACFKEERKRCDVVLVGKGHYYAVHQVLLSQEVLALNNDV
eukprot:RCo045476